MTATNDRAGAGLPELLPCPFCGKPVSFCTECIASPECHRVMCNTCGDFDFSLEGDPESLPEKQALSAERWNKRAARSGVVGWQPIESAPAVDGTVLIGWGEYRERDGFGPAFMRWYDSVGGWSVNCLPFYPTHWQPLPSPPSEPATGAGELNG